MIINRKISNRSAQNRHDIENKADESTVYLYGDIGGYFGIDHLEFVKAFNAVTSGVIHLRVDSGGGDIFAARAIKTAIMQHKAKVIAHVDGLAASAASFIILGADEVEIVNGGFLMTHNALSFMDVFGFFNISDLTRLSADICKEIDLHKKINESIANDYMKKTRKKMEDVQKWMDEETWFTAQEALDNGLVDRIYDGEPVEGSYDLSVFAKAPDSLRLRNQKTSKRTAEKALRDVGFSQQQAKAILSGGLKEEAYRDDETPITPQPTEAERDVTPVVAKKKDRIAELLTRAEMLAPAK